MKKSVVILLLSLVHTCCVGQDKTFTGSYVKTITQETEDGSYVKVELKGSDGKIISFLEPTETFMADASKKKELTGAGASFGDITNKSNTNRSCSVNYYTNEVGLNVIKSFVISGPQIRTISGPPQISMDSSYKIAKAIQTKISPKYKCPDCPIEGTKEYIKEYIGMLNKQFQAATKPKDQEKISKTIEFLKSSLAENKFLTYYFNDKRASVILTKKFNNRYFAIQTKKQSKWTGLGIDDNFASCKDLKKEDEVSIQDAVNCAVYLDKVLKEKGH